jgi:hypothetical protein
VVAEEEEHGTTIILADHSYTAKTEAEEVTDWSSFAFKEAHRMQILHYFMLLIMVPEPALLLHIKHLMVPQPAQLDRHL